MKITRRVAKEIAGLKGPGRRVPVTEDALKSGRLVLFIYFAALFSSCGDPRFIDGDALSPKVRSEPTEIKPGEGSTKPLEVPSPTHEERRRPPDSPARPGNPHSKKGDLNPEKSTVEILECHFAKSEAGKGQVKGAGNGKGEKTLRCSAFAKIHAKKTHSDPTVLHPKPGPGNDEGGTKVHPDRLTVICGGESVFSGEAAHTLMTENELLIGNLSTDDHPLIILSFPFGHPNTDPRPLDSSLTIGDIHLAGTCDKIDEMDIR